MQEVRWDKEGSVRAGNYTFFYAEERRPLGRPRRRWEDNNMDGGTDWIDLAQDRDRWRALVNTMMNTRGP